LYNRILPQDALNVVPDDGRKEGRNLYYKSEFNYKYRCVKDEQCIIFAFM